MRCEFLIGDLVEAHPGYPGGIWLREKPGTNLSPGSGCVTTGFLIVLEIDKEIYSRDPCIKVLSSCGLFGWTFQSRLQKIF